MSSSMPSPAASPGRKMKHGEKKRSHSQVSEKIESHDYKNRTYLSAVEAAGYLNISVKALHDLVRRQVISTQTAASGQMRFDLNELKNHAKKFSPHVQRLSLIHI